MPFIKRSFLVRLNFYAFVNVAVCAADSEIARQHSSSSHSSSQSSKLSFSFFFLIKVNDGSGKKRDND